MSVQASTITYREKLEDCFVSTTGTLDQINMIDDLVIRAIYEIFQAYKNRHKDICRYKSVKHVQYTLKFQNRSPGEKGDYLTRETINSAGKVKVEITCCKRTPLPKTWLFSRE